MKEIKAAADLKLAITNASTPDEITYFNLGNIYFKKSRFTDAVTAYTNTLQHNPRHKGSFLNRANSYLSLKNYKAAINDYENFLQLLENKQSRPEVEQMINHLKATLTRVETIN